MMRTWAAALACAVLAAAVLALAPGARVEAGATDPEQVVEDFFAELNAGDVEGALALVSDDFVLTDIDGGSFAAVGKPAFRSALQGAVDGNAEITIAEISSSGNTVTGVIEWRDDFTAEVGVDRYLQPFTVQVNAAGLATRGDFTYDEDDPDTAEFLAALEEDDGGEDELPPGTVTVQLAAQPGGNQPGQAFIFEEEAGVTGVFLSVTPGPAGVQQPAHFHTGTCAAPGPIVEPLGNVLDGESFTLLSATMSELVDQGLIINVHKSAAELSVYVSCGVVVSQAAATPTAQATVAPAATATRPVGVTAPDTGTGGSNAANNASWLYVALIAGLALTAGGAALAFARR